MPSDMRCRKSDSAAAVNSGPVMLKFAVDSRPRASRSKNTKSRSGCITCKRRRVRCDEGKPSCLNCAKSKRTCEGYVQKASAAEALKLTEKSNPLLAKPNYESHMFTNQLEKDHFDYWMAFTKEFSLFPTDLTSQLLPQIAREEPAIRHAAFAIGAAAMGASTRADRTSGKGTFASEALMHYGRAIHIIRSSQDSKSIPRALLSCLLFVTFESLRGDPQAALVHMTHGCNILDQLMRRGASGDCPPELIEEVFTSFRRFYLLSWAFDGSHSTETETYVPWCCRGKTSRYRIDEMPNSFKTALDAHKWWEVVHHHILIKSKVAAGFAFEGPQSMEPNDRPLRPEETSKYPELLENWYARFKPLMNLIVQQRESSLHASLQVLTLRLMYMSLELSVRSLQFTDMDVLASSAATFKEMVSLSRTILSCQLSERSSSQDVFSMETSPAWPLMFVGIFCHEQELREEARQLMRKYPRRDALWDSRAFEAVCKASWELRDETSAGGMKPSETLLPQKKFIFGRNGILRRYYYPPSEASVRGRVMEVG
ncbi:C6 zinc finger domain protein [Colletotrichum musicola]|uniref:C6 zinc finger domain protein n=1 Tax=Colletotrichum musicola TaxID=2175873 RepID=A0A8H6N8Z5_9PEZI|nr:C6 zinc finger domain protein [Colletotrichum musicola]